MLTISGSPRRCCDGLTRRETLKAGALSTLGGFGLPQFLQAEEAGHVEGGKAKSVILLYLLGGAATQDMFDLKPDAPAEVRSQFKPIATSAPGIDVCEHLPQMAGWMHRAAVVRSVNHRAGCHNTLPSYTGHEVMLSNITSTKNSYPPSMGSVCEYIRQQSGDRSSFPDYVYMPCYLGWGQNIRRPGPYAARRRHQERHRHGPELHEPFWVLRGWKPASWPMGLRLIDSTRGGLCCLKWMPDSEHSKPAEPSNRSAAVSIGRSIF